jgi:hypothetical protein
MYLIYFLNGTLALARTYPIDGPPPAEDADPYLPVPVPEYFQRLPLDHPLMNYQSLDQSLGAYLIVEDKMLAATSCLLRRSNFSGPADGVMISAHYIGRYIRTHFSQSTQLCINVWHNSGNLDLLPPDVQSALPNLQAIPASVDTGLWGTSSFVQMLTQSYVASVPSAATGRICADVPGCSPDVEGSCLEERLKEDRIASYILLQEASGNGTFVVRCDAPIDIVLLGQKSTSYSYILLTVGCIVFGITVFVVSELLILARVRIITRHLNHIVMRGAITLTTSIVIFGAFLDLFRFHI